MQAMQATFSWAGRTPIVLWAMSVPVIMLFAVFCWHAI